MFHSDDEVIVNAGDIADVSWRELFAIRLDTGTITLTESFIVAADSLQDALDEVADYIVARGWRGYFATPAEVYEDCDHAPTYDDCDCDADYIIAGNDGIYLRDAGNIQVTTLATSTYCSGWRWIVAPACDTVERIAA